MPLENLVGSAWAGLLLDVMVWPALQCGAWPASSVPAGACSRREPWLARPIPPHQHQHTPPPPPGARRAQVRRMQVQGREVGGAVAPRYASTLDCARQMLAQEGLRSFWRGT